MEINTNEEFQVCQSCGTVPRWCDAGSFVVLIFLIVEIEDRFHLFDFTPFSVLL